MSEIINEILKATDSEDQGRREDDQKFYDRLITATDKLSDRQFDKLSESARDWINAGIAAIKAEKDIPSPTAAEPEPEPETSSRRGRRGASEPEPAAKFGVDDVKKGQVVKIVADGGKFDMEGTVTEVDSKGFTLKDDKGAETLGKDEIESIELITDVEETSSRRGGSRRGASAGDSDDKGGEAKPTRNTGITNVLRQAIVDNPDSDKAAVVEYLNKKGVEFKQSTLDILFSDVSKTIAMMRDAGWKAPK